MNPQTNEEVAPFELVKAIWSNDFPAVIYLVEGQNAELNNPAKLGWALENTPILSYLVSQGAKANALTTNMDTPWHELCMKIHGDSTNYAQTAPVWKERAEILLRAEADVTKTNRLGYTGYQLIGDETIRADFERFVKKHQEQKQTQATQSHTECIGKGRLPQRQNSGGRQNDGSI